MALDVSDPVMRRRVEQLFAACFQVRRAVQRDARHRVDAYWAAVHERRRDCKAVVNRLGLDRKGLEAAAKGHLDAAPHLRRWCTKALGLHLADTVWEATRRHLYRDKADRRHGKLKVTKWWDFTRIPGRARSRTGKNKWETFRLHGTLDASRAAMRPVGWRNHRPVPTPSGPHADTDWWTYDGPLTVVMTGVDNGPIVLPVRLPGAPSAQAHLDWHLFDSSLWHKIDLVRHRDPNAAGGWIYEAHLQCLVAPYVSDGTRERRARAADDTVGRRAGIDVNVSNVTIASHHDGGELKVTTIQRTADERQRQQLQLLRQRRQAKALERSRRASNRDQYHLSARQNNAGKRRADRGLPAKQVVPMGPRKARKDGRSEQAYRRDRLSASYQRGRAAVATQARAAAIARRQTAARLAGDLVATHGTDLTAETGRISDWGRWWGRALHAFTPGLLIAAFEREANAVAGVSVKKAGTRQTAMSQHCLCGHRVAKTLSDRIHDCAACGLASGRDAVAAVLAACVDLADPTDPSTAAVDYRLARRMLHDPDTWRTLEQTRNIPGVQERPRASTDTPDSDPRSAEGTRPPADTHGSAPRTGTVPTTTPNEPPTGDHVGTTSTTNSNAPPGPTHVASDARGIS